jgi:hypothetical protein
VYGRNEDRSRDARCRFQEGCSGDQARVPP